MPWSKQFEPDEVLACAMQVFWDNGYQGTSVQHLVSQTGVNRASLYGTFGDKRSLFIAAIRRYDRTQRAAWFHDLRAIHGPRDAIIAAFREAVDAAADGGARGCLLVNTALELAGHDPDVCDLVDDAFDETERFFGRMLDAAKQAGEVDRDLDTAVTAAGLLSLFLGVRVLSRGRHPDTLALVQRHLGTLLY